MLDHHRHVRLEDRAVVGGPGDGFRVGEVVEPDMPGAAGGNGELVGPGRVAIGEEDRDAHVGVNLAGVEDADGLVAGHGRLGAGAAIGDVPLGNGPPSRAYRLHWSSSLGDERDP